MWLKILIKYWQPILAIILSLGLSYVVGDAIHDRVTARLKIKYEAQIEAQKVADRKQCDKEKTASWEANRDLEDAISALNNERNNNGMRGQAACIPIIFKHPASGGNAASPQK